MLERGLLRKKVLKRKKISYILLLLLLVVFCSTFASASFLVSSETRNEKIFPWEKTLFELKIKNNGNSEDTAIVYIPSNIEWTVITDPVYNKFKLKPGESTTVKVYIRPVDEEKIHFKQYNLPYYVISENTGRKYPGVFTLFVRDPERVKGYLPAIYMDVQLDKKLDPRNDAVLALNFVNKNRLNITGLKIEITSEINKANNQVKLINISPKGSKKLEFRISYDNLERPNKDVITITTSIPSMNITLDRVRRVVEILAYSNVDEQLSVKKSFFKKVENISFFNDGNIAAIKELVIKASVFKSLFVSSVPAYDIKYIGNERSLYWELKLEPQERKNVVIVTNYRPLLVILFLAALLVAGYFFLRSPIIIQKNCSIIKKRNKSHEKEISRLKVILHIKNRTSNIMDDVVVVDRIPGIAELEDDFGLGTLRPTKIIKNEKRGTLLKWNIGSLEPYEERIISYKLSSKLNVIGEISLKQAMVKFKGRFGKTNKAYSNQAKVS